MTVMAFDFGTTKIGIAVGNQLTATARGLRSVQSHNGTDWDSIDALLAEWQPEALVVGLPLTEDGGEQPMTSLARKFSRQLEARQSRPVHLVDERYSSHAAQTLLRDERASGTRTKRLKKGDIDAEAAAILLRNWLNL